MTTPTLASIDTHVCAERFAQARLDVDAALAAAPSLELHLARARLELARGGNADEIILELQARLDDADATAEQRQRGAEIVAGAYTRKRLPALARDAIAACEAAHGPTPGLHVARAHAALVDDDRPAAHEAFAAALALAPDHGAARRGLGELLWVMADFAAAEAELVQVPPRSRHWGAALRARAGFAEALGDRARAVALRAELVAGRPDGDWVQGDLIALALAEVALDRRDAALATLRRAWQHAPDTGHGRYARERMTHLESAPADALRRELTAFPTTAQKWNYCGPAVLELVLRYFEFAADQDSIASLVKRETGTPMFEIVRHLQAVGVEARRCEGSTARIRAAIDLGCPVIVQEEYSTSSHVAVITGYDDRLGVFVAQDPMSHQPMVKSFTFTENAGTMYGNGIVVVLGPPALAEGRRAAADAAELVDAKHLSLVDECARRRGEEALSAQEVVGLCDQALRLAPSFRLAHWRRFLALQELARHGGLSGDDVLRELALLRLRFGGEEWAHVIHASSLLERGLYDEAFTQAMDAQRLDRHDEHNLAMMGEARWLAGDLASAERYLLEALAVGPDLRRAGENLAAVYLRTIEEIDAETADDARPPAMPPRKLRSMVARPLDELRRRAAHFSTVAITGNADNPFNHAVAGELAMRAGDLAEGIAALRRCLELDPQRASAAASLADLLERAGDLDGALAQREAIVERWPGDAAGILQLAALRRRCDDHEAAADLLRTAIATVESGREELVAPLFDALEYLGTGEAAAAQIRAFAEERLGDADVVSAAVDALERNGQRGHAIALARHLYDQAPHDVTAVWRLARLLDDSGVAADEAAQLLEEVVALAPDVAIVRARLAWHRIAEAPEAALAMLEPVLAEELPEVYDAQAAALAALGRTDEAERALGRALQAAPSALLGLARLSARHANANRYARAVELARRIDPAELAAIEDGDEREYVEDSYVMAFRLAGKASEVLPWVRARCADGVPPHLAFEVYYAFRTQDRALAARAAEVRAAELDDPADQLEWRVIAASLHAKLGDPAQLDAIARDLPPQAGAWAELADAYVLVDRYAEADAAAARAFELDPLHGPAFAARIASLERLVRLDEAVACARTFCAARPWEHQGPERLGILCAKLGQLEEALAMSARAVDAAPYCHVSQASRALALFAAGDRDGALEMARWARGTEPRAADAEGDDDADLLIAALTGDAAALERGLAAAQRKAPGAYLDHHARLREAVRVS